MKNSMSGIWNFISYCESDNKCKERVQANIDNGADITADDNWAVQCAAENGKTEMVKFLLENGATLQE